MFDGAGAIGLAAGLLVFVAYRRIRRQFGRQKVTTVRLGLRIVLLSLLAVLMTGLPSTSILLAFGSLTSGWALGIYAVRFSTFEHERDAIYVTPNSYIGVAVALVLVTRLVARMVRLRTAASAAALGTTNGVVGLDAVGLVRSPVTRALLLVLLAYYVAYYVGVLVRTHARPLPS